jgi:hypothetical protein
VGTNPRGVAVADLNGDGRPDLVVTNFKSNTVSVLLGNGDGTFAAAHNFAVGDEPSKGAVLADLNGDGRPDLAVANFGSNTVSVLLGNGDGTFAAAQNFATGTQPNGVVAADLNGDGRLDLATSNFGSNSVSVLLGNRNAAKHFQITAPASVTAGTPFTITVTALTAGNGRDCLYTGTVKFTSSDSNAVLPGNYSFTKLDGGSHTFTVTLNSPGARTLTATDTAHSGTNGTAFITVNATPGAPPTPNSGSGRAATTAASGTGGTISPEDAVAVLAAAPGLSTASSPHALTAPTTNSAPLPMAARGPGALVVQDPARELPTTGAVLAPSVEKRPAEGSLGLAALEAYFAAVGPWGEGA